MAREKASELRKQDMPTLQKKMSELKLELSKEKANAYVGANVTSPGRIKEIRRSIARINTVLAEMQGKKAKEEAG